MTVMIRSRDDLESQRALAAHELDVLGAGASVETRGFYSGVIEALDWLLGRSPLGPVTASFSDELTMRVIADEQQAAQDVLYGRRDGGERVRSWYSSVDHVLSWVLSESTGRPLSSADDQLRSAAAIRREAAILTAQRSTTAAEADRQSIDGALSALAWLVGEGDGPMSGLPRRVGGPSADQVGDEAELSHLRRFADKADQDARWSFVFGVDKALDWAFGDDNTPAL